MDIRKLPSYKGNWSFKQEITDDCISNWFAWYLKNLHINNVLQPKTKGLHYYPTKRQSIDERMIIFKARSSLHQYLLMKL